MNLLVASDLTFAMYSQPLGSQPSASAVMMAGINLVGVPQTKPIQWFQQTFHLPLKDIELISFWVVSGNYCSRGNAFSDFWILTLVGVPQTKHLQWLSVNFQDMVTCTEKGCRAIVVALLLQIFKCCFLKLPIDGLGLLPVTAGYFHVRFILYVLQGVPWVDVNSIF